MIHELSYDHTWNQTYVVYLINLSSSIWLLLYWDSLSLVGYLLMDGEINNKTNIKHELTYATPDGRGDAGPVARASYIRTNT